MCAEKVGALLVCDAGKPVGMFTERDLMNSVILARLDPATTTVGEVMSREVVYVEPTAAAAEAMAVMTERRCRHLPVASEGQLMGLISIGDLVRWASRNQEFEIRKLTDYIHGKYPG
jgi:CBS domain-containing protein